MSLGMNILLITETYFPWITGVSVSTDNIAKFLASKGHNVTLVCPKQHVPGSPPKHKNIKVVIVPSLPFSFYNNNAPALIFPSFKILNNLVKKEKFDIVHIQEPGTLGLIALIVSKIHHLPTVGALHFIPEQIDRVMWGSLERVLTPIINIFTYLIYNRYDQVMAPSHFFAGYLKGIGVKTSVNVISNGIDTNIYKPKRLDLKTREKYGFLKSDIVFFFLGRLDKDKNPETLIKALPYTPNNIKLLIVGRGTETKYLHELSLKLKVNKKIVWANYVTDVEMQNLYASVDAFCIMSPYEGQSIVTLQAVAAGLPVIAAKAGALPELVDNGRNGYLIDTYNHKDLAEKMVKLAKDVNLRKKFGRQSRKISLSHERNKVFLKLTEIYENIRV
jgi:glycosyltransferase involved in cell wall biosynthesis